MAATTNFGCVGNTIRTRSGRYLNLANPGPSEIVIGDISCGLARTCRFGGQVDRFYSVAEHSIFCAEQAAKDGLPLHAQLAALMHDATEAYIGDIVKPLKVMLPQYAEVEGMLDAVIREKFSITSEFDEQIKEIDRGMLIAERRALFSADRVKWAGEDEARSFELTLICMPPRDAELEFLNRFLTLDLLLGS